MGCFDIQKLRESSMRQLARTIKKKYPPSKYPRVVDVAGGDGYLTELLVKAGYKVTLIDPRGKRVKGAKLRKRKFLIKDANKQDLLIGFLPCSASQKLLRAAKYKPVIFVPCGCRSVWPGNRLPHLEASAFLKKQRVKFKKDGNWYFAHGRE